MTTSRPRTRRTDRLPRFELVRTPAGFHQRFVAPNGRVISSSEVHPREGSAITSIEIVTGFTVAPYFNNLEVWHAGYDALLEVRRTDAAGNPR